MILRYFVCHILLRPNKNNHLFSYIHRPVILQPYSFKFKFSRIISVYEMLVCIPYLPSTLSICTSMFLVKARAHIFHQANI